MLCLMSGLVSMFTYTLALMHSYLYIYLYSHTHTLTPMHSHVYVTTDNLLGGQIALGFFIIGGFISVIAGYLTDVWNRVRLFAGVVILGELSCILTYWSTTYTQLYVCRVLTGVSIGGANPILFSLLADFYSGEWCILLHI